MVLPLPSLFPSHSLSLCFIVYVFFSLVVVDHPNPVSYVALFCFPSYLPSTTANL